MLKFIRKIVSFSFKVRLCLPSRFDLKKVIVMATEPADAAKAKSDLNFEHQPVKKMRLVSDSEFGKNSAVKQRTVATMCGAWRPEEVDGGLIFVFKTRKACLSPDPTKESDYPENIEDFWEASFLSSDDEQPDLIRKYGYPVEEHTVTTEDGYILGMHRIPHGRDNNDLNVVRPIVFLMHGLLSSSADWVIMGPGSGFGYILAESGYDVWMGNARGNYYSREHIRLNPDSLLSTAFWKFSWDEIGNVDLPAMIDYALGVAGQKRMHYVGHSQGTTAFFVMTSLRPDYNEKIISMHAFAPVAYMAHNRNPLLLFISPFANNIEAITSLMGIGEFMPNTNINQWAGEAFCRDTVATQEICSHIVFLVGGYNECQHNATMLPAFLGHAPAGSSVRQYAHYGQGIAGKEFRRYDQGSRLANWRTYGSFNPPRYDLSKVTTPVFLHYSESDPLAEVPDVDRLFRELGRPIGKFRIPMTTFSHIDFVWGIDAKELIYDRTINLIRAMDIHA